MNKSELSKKFPATIGKITIRENAYIGVSCCVLKAVEIGESSIVAAKSLVNKNIDSFSIYGGIPAKKIKTIE